MEVLLRAALWLLAMLYAAYDSLGRTCQKAWFWWNGGALLWASVDGRLVPVKAPEPHLLCLCDFLGPDGSVMHTLSRGGRVPTLHEHKVAARRVHTSVLAISVQELEGLRRPPGAVAEAGRVLYLRAAGIGPLTDARPFELVGLAEAALGLPCGCLAPRVSVTYADFSTRTFDAGEVVQLSPARG